MLVLLRLRHQRINGGSSDTEVNELAVVPTGSPSARTAVTTVTPVANVPQTSRSSPAAADVVVCGAFVTCPPGKGTPGVRRRRAPPIARRLRRPRAAKRGRGTLPQYPQAPPCASEDTSPRCG